MKFLNDFCYFVNVISNKIEKHHWLMLELGKSHNFSRYTRLSCETYLQMLEEFQKSHRQNISYKRYKIERNSNQPLNKAIHMANDASSTKTHPPPAFLLRRCLFDWAQMFVKFGINQLHIAGDRFWLFCCFVMAEPGCVHVFFSGLVGLDKQLGRNVP